MIYEGKRGRGALPSGGCSYNDKRDAAHRSPHTAFSIGTGTSRVYYRIVGAIRYQTPVSWVQTPQLTRPKLGSEEAKMESSGPPHILMRVSDRKAIRALQKAHPRRMLYSPSVCRIACWMATTMQFPACAGGRPPGVQRPDAFRLTCTRAWSWALLAKRGSARARVSVASVCAPVRPKHKILDIGDEWLPRRVISAFRRFRSLCNEPKFACRTEH